jgi:RNA polymerase sigma-70 factor (ECF subfamily)
VTQTATREIWDKFRQPLLAYVQRRIPERGDAEDIVQDVFVKVHEKIGTLRQVNLGPWLYTVARNSVVDFYRSRRRLVELPETLDAEYETSEDDIRAHMATWLGGMIESLPEKYRQVVRLSELEGLNHKELAERLDLSLSGVKSRVQRGRRLLHKALLDCCHFEFDARGRVIDYAPRPQCCPRCQAQCRPAGPSSRKDCRTNQG